MAIQFLISVGRESKYEIGINLNSTKYIFSSTALRYNFEVLYSST